MKAEELRKITRAAKEKAEKGDLIKKELLEKEKESKERMFATAVRVIDGMLVDVAKEGKSLAEFIIPDELGGTPSYVPEGERMECVTDVSAVNTSILAGADELPVRLYEHYRSSNCNCTTQLLSVSTAYGQYRGHHIRIIISW